ncbi:MAG: hypothetical protein R2862_06025 [Thermoanaerobaculia bacterium]
MRTLQWIGLETPQTLDPVTEQVEPQRLLLACRKEASKTPLRNAKFTGLTTRSISAGSRGPRVAPPAGRARLTPAHELERPETLGIRQAAEQRAA